jgi:hypothetical protein
MPRSVLNYLELSAMLLTGLIFGQLKKDTVKMYLTFEFSAMGFVHYFIVIHFI